MGFTFREFSEEIPSLRLGTSGQSSAAPGL
jgi:hypothetical protein